VGVLKQKTFRDVNKRDRSREKQRSGSASVAENLTVELHDLTRTEIF